ncbi:hypothetical protein [Thalassospira lucentensis]|uniref:hypothetical protein n=1 Tax=Thalassospira lucentensis TaxID=168935 RepID=UPI00142E8067|nr:hypothetical protein [Thalassospira lucentensis]NIZ02549.1 hypothetical protein [Thalassospira lucentensis]
MTKLTYIAITVVIAAFAFIVLFLGVNAACTNSPNFHCVVWRGFEWESILAGALGLMGGIFVITSSRAQIAAMQETADRSLRQAKLHRADEASTPLELAREVAVNFQAWAEYKLSCIDELEQNHMSTPMRLSLGDNLYGETHQMLVQRCDHVTKIVNAHAMTSFNFEVSKALTQLADSKGFVCKPATPTPANNPITDDMVKLKHKLNEARESANLSSECILAQIGLIYDRCGVDDS